MPAKSDAVDQMAGMAFLATLLNQMEATARNYSDEDIQYSKDGKFVIPAGMTIADAAKHLAKVGKDQEAIHSFHHDILCAIPADGLASTWRVFLDRFNLVVGRKLETMFFTIPPGFLNIKTGDGIISVPRGRFALADFDKDEWLELIPHGGDKPGVIVRGEIKKRQLKFLNGVMTEIEERLKTDSIYRGKTVSFDTLDWVNEDGDFDYNKSVPEIREFSENVRWPKLNRPAEVAIRTQVVNRITGKAENTKSVVFLAGYFGTGKSLQCRALSALANENGWTVVHLRSARDAIKGLRLASMLRREGAGVLIIIEDIDEVTSGPRNSTINDLSNVIDGVNKESMDNVILVMTTNSPRNISPVFLRRGWLVELQLPDAETREAMIREWLGDRMGDEFNIAEAVECSENFAPSFMEMAAHACLSSTDEDIDTDTFCGIMESLRGQADQVRQQEIGNQVSRNDQFVGLLQDTVHEAVSK